MTKSGKPCEMRGMTTEPWDSSATLTCDSMALLLSDVANIARLKMCTECHTRHRRSRTAGAPVSPKVLKELQDIFADAARTDMWGTVEIDFQRGVPVVIRQTRSKKLEENNSAYANKNRY
jgi:hypothetical protein